MTFCSEGQDAHLWINGNEHWKFPGPIEVSLELETGDTLYPNLWEFRIYVGIWRCNDKYQASSLVWRYGSRNRFAYWAWWISEDSNGKFPGWARYINEQGYPVEVPSDPFDGVHHAWLPNPPNHFNRGNIYRWSATCGGYNQPLSPAEPALGEIFYRERLGHNQDPVPGESVYKLLVNGKTIKSSPNPIEYEVKCGDRCPPGMKWNKRCGKCVCENMGALKWHLGNAVDIARLI